MRKSKIKIECDRTASWNARKKLSALEGKGVKKRGGHRDTATNAIDALFFLVPRSTISEPPIALFPTLIRWWEWFRAESVVEWKSRRDINWNACSKSVGGAGRAEWASLLEMESMGLTEVSLAMVR